MAWYPVHCSVWRLWLDVCCSAPSDTEFPWRQGRPSASNEDMKRWTTALHSLRPKTPTMTSPAATALTAATASTPPPVLHLPVRNTRRHMLTIPACLMRRKCLITPLKSLSLSPAGSHLHPQTAQAVTGGQAGAFWCGDGLLLPPAAGIHQRAQPGGQLPGHGTSPLLHQTLHPGRVRPGAGDQPPAHSAPAPSPGEAECPKDEGRVQILSLGAGWISSKVNY